MSHTVKVPDPVYERAHELASGEDMSIKEAIRELVFGDCGCPESVTVENPHDNLRAATLVVDGDLGKIEPGESVEVVDR